MYKLRKLIWWSELLVFFPVCHFMMILPCRKIKCVVIEFPAFSSSTWGFCIILGISALEESKKILFFPGIFMVSFFKFWFFFFKIYLFINSEREAETQAEGEAGSMQGARHGTRSWVSRITPWAAGGAKLLRHRGCPKFRILIYLEFVIKCEVNL